MKLNLAIFSCDENFANYISTIEIVNTSHSMIFQDLRGFFKEKNCAYDVILIDYDTAKEVGIEIASLENFYDATIIFVTSHSLLHVNQKLKVKGKFYHPLRFVYRQQLSSELIRTANELLHKQGSINIKVNKDLYKLYFYEIYEVYSADHYLIFNLINSPNPIRSRMWINDIASQLLENGFVKTKGGAYINLRYIKHIVYETNEIYFTNGKHTTFSRRNYHEIAKRFLEEI